MATEIEQDETETEVMFRYWQKNVIALMPYDIQSRDRGVYLAQSYMHIGQHSSADCAMIVDCSRPATEAEYASLKSEMEGLGYKVKVIHRTRYTKLSAARDQFRKDMAAL